MRLFQKMYYQHNILCTWVHPHFTSLSPSPNLHIRSILSERQTPISQSPSAISFTGLHIMLNIETFT